VVTYPLETRQSLCWNLHLRHPFTSQAVSLVLCRRVECFLAVFAVGLRYAGYARRVDRHRDRRRLWCITIEVSRALFWRRAL
jgi:hypothetical protein